MKRFVYFSLFYTAGITIQLVYVSGMCDYDVEEEGMVVCDSSEGIEDVLDGILSNITKLDLFSFTTDDYHWTITKPDIFSRFYKLYELRINGPFSFSPNIFDTTDKLAEKFFNIKTLNAFHASNCLFSRNDEKITVKWKLPPSLQRIFLLECDPENFDWEGVDSLIRLEIYDMNNSSFLNLDKIAYPSALSLEELHTYDVDNIIKISDIAYFCNLKIFSFNYALLTQPNIDVHCECQRYYDWKDFLFNEENMELEFEVEPECSKPNWDCSNYTLDEAKQNRTKCLRLAKRALSDTVLVYAFLAVYFFHCIVFVFIFGIVFVKFITR